MSIENESQGSEGAGNGEELLEVEDKDNGHGTSSADEGDVEQASGEERPPSPYLSQMRWYIVHAYSGFEGKVKQALEERIRQYKMEQLFGRIEVPQETVVEMVKGQKKTGSRKLFPGYVFVQMVFNQDTWHLVRETPKVTGFLGGDQSDPAPLSDDEVDRMLVQMKEGTKPSRSKVSFEKGDIVKIKDGPFTDFSGSVELVNAGKGKLTVSISIFNRATPVELDFAQVEKV